MKSWNYKQVRQQHALTVASSAAATSVSNPAPLLRGGSGSASVTASAAAPGADSRTEDSACCAADVEGGVKVDVVGSERAGLMLANTGAIGEKKRGTWVDGEWVAKAPNGEGRPQDAVCSQIYGHAQTALGLGTLLSALEGDVGKGGGVSLEGPEVSAPTPVAERGGMAGGNADEGSLALPGTGPVLLPYGHGQGQVVLNLRARD